LHTRKKKHACKLKWRTEGSSPSFFQKQNLEKKETNQSGGLRTIFQENIVQLDDVLASSVSGESKSVWHSKIRKRKFRAKEIVVWQRGQCLQNDWLSRRREHGAQCHVGLPVTSHRDLKPKSKASISAMFAPCPCLALENRWFNNIRVGSNQTLSHSIGGT
jgi:hypothetical protein